MAGAGHTCRLEPTCENTTSVGPLHHVTIVPHHTGSHTVHSPHPAPPFSHRPPLLMESGSTAWLWDGWRSSRLPHTVPPWVSQCAAFIHCTTLHVVPHPSATPPRHLGWQLIRFSFESLTYYPWTPRVCVAVELIALLPEHGVQLETRSLVYHRRRLVPESDLHGVLINEVIRRVSVRCHSLTGRASPQRALPRDVTRC